MGWQEELGACHSRRGKASGNDQQAWFCRLPHMQVMTFETSRRNAIQDSTESLKATVMDSAVSDFCHEQHVSTLLKVTDATSWECG